MCHSSAFRRGGKGNGVHDSVNHGFVDCLNWPIMFVHQGQGETVSGVLVLMGLQQSKTFFSPACLPPWGKGQRGKGVEYLSEIKDAKHIRIEATGTALQD